MLTLNYAGDTAAEAPSQHLGLEDFERAGVRVAERRFGEKDTIFAPGDPDGQLYFLLEGTVHLYKIYGDYKEATITLLKDGRYLLNGRPRAGRLQCFFRLALSVGVSSRVWRHALRV